MVSPEFLIGMVSLEFCKVTTRIGITTPAGQG